MAHTPISLNYKNPGIANDPHLVLQQPGKVVERFCHIRVVRTIDPLIDRQGALVQGSSLRKLALGRGNRI